MLMLRYKDGYWSDFVSSYLCVDEFGVEIQLLKLHTRHDDVVKFE